METLSQPYKILVVDDEPTNLKLLREILRHEYALVFARNGEEMLRYVVDKPDLILLDIMMPNMDGYEACARLKANEATRDIPVIFVTAKIETEDEVRGLEAGAVDYLTKPVQGAIVRARVKTHLQLLQARRLIQQQNEALRHAARLRDDVEQMVRHDLKGPLNAIIGMPGALIAEGKLDEDQVLFLQAIEEAGFRMLEMINHSHDLYKMEQGRYPLEAKPVDILVVLKRILSEINRVMQKKKITLDILLHGRPVLPGDVFMVSGEELLCHSMLSNVLKNGVEASPANEFLRVSLDIQEQALLRIGNKGSVPVGIRATFFDKYVTSGKSKGVGLGTYSAKLIATTLGGGIELDTSQEGETFIEIRLPLVT
ncbi:MAG: hybrid sensor histidine kinase/response regulator [Magnetococcales bacterium]|nr:hybrid sensor histidine kinase/response regulator [Magnetococcales bacterium]MBF0438806.1 hybrid sensor histidine kinase/response regulator [Magnetococcales bacterium]